MGRASREPCTEKEPLLKKKKGAQRQRRKEWEGEGSSSLVRKENQELGQESLVRDFCLQPKPAPFLDLPVTLYTVASH